MDINVLEDMATDFLWATYFGITTADAENDKDNAALCCAARAYRDLCRVIPYKHSSSTIEKNKKKYSDYIGKKSKFRDAVCEYIVTSIEKIDGDFETFHRKTCRGIISLSDGTDKMHPDYSELFKADKNEKIGLNYGLAQKWLNMTIKNMLVMGIWGEKLNKYMDDIHIPLDSYIFDAAGGTKGEPIYGNEGVKHLGIKVKKYFGNNTWSQIPDESNQIEAYYSYQSEIQTLTGNEQIKWEHDAWIAESKKIQKKNRK